MQANVFILDHDPPGGQQLGNIQVLGQVAGRGRQAGTQLRLFTGAGESNAIGGTDIHTGVTLDAANLLKYGLYIAIQAALGFLEAGFQIEAQFHFDFAVFQGLALVRMRH